jgi:mannose-6-phosphate isomerase-like protein (cupin superfamily)
MRRVDKPWGHELVWAETGRYVGKILHIRAGGRLSRQYHRVKEETLMVKGGEMDLEIGPAGAFETRRLRPGDVFHVAPGTIHRMIGVTDVDVIEVSTPEIDDVVRLEDVYGREGTSKA